MSNSRLLFRVYTFKTKLYNPRYSLKNKQIMVKINSQFKISNKLKIDNFSNNLNTINQIENQFSKLILHRS